MQMKPVTPLLILLLTSCSSQLPFRQTASTSRPIFEDITYKTGVANKHSTSVTVGDFDNDGKVDFIAHHKLYRNISEGGNIKFADITTATGLARMSGMPAFLDVNNDGQLDIVTTKGQLFIQKNKYFYNVASQYGLRMASDAMTISFGDLNGDGFPDLIVGRTEIYKNNVFNFVPPQIFINVNGKAFREVSSQQGMSKFPAYTRGIVWADYNNDKSPDIYFSNYRLKQNFLFQTHKGKMKDVAQQAGVQGEFNPNKYYDNHLQQKLGPKYGHTIGSVWADLDNDGNLDLFVSNLVHKFVGTPKNKTSYDYRGYVCDDSKVYKNTGAPHYKFIDMRAKSGLPVKPIGDYSKYQGDELWAHATAADFDNDGLIDLYVSQVYNLNYAYSLLFKNRGNFRFQNLTHLGPKIYDSYAGAWADFNNDGKMDLIVSGREAVDATPRIRIFKNVIDNDNNFLRVKLIGTKSGKVPVTTQVRVFHKNGQFLRQVEGVTGTLNQQNDSTLHFGLGKIEKIDRIEITWSSGLKQVKKNIQPNKTYVFTEGK